MDFPKGYFEDEVRDGFYVPSLMKRGWAAQIEVMLDIDHICKENGIRYYLDWGTLLGAVRHGGFIPWDDDVDIAMPRVDYNRFAEIAQDLLPEGYRLLESKQCINWNELLMRVNNIEGDYQVTTSFCQKFHGFIFPAGVDIFAHDVLPDDEKKKSDLLYTVYALALLKNDLEELEEEEREKRITQYETSIRNEEIPLTLPRGENAVHELVQLIEYVRGLYQEEASAEVSLLVQALDKHSCIFPSKAFSQTKMLNFEGVDFPCPIGTKDVLTAYYGDYTIPYKDKEGHEYPYFHKFFSVLDANSAQVRTFFYHPLEDEKINNLSRKGLSWKQYFENNLEALHSCHRVLVEEVYALHDQMVFDYLEKCQLFAIRLGEALEKRFAHAPNLEKKWAEEQVHGWEYYCELLCLLQSELIEGNGHWQETLLQMENFTQQRANEMKNCPNRRLILFIPWKQEGWANCERLYQECLNQADCEVQVMPIPYYLRGDDGTASDTIDESYAFSNLHPIPFETFDFSGVRPDMIVFQNPYDQYNFGSSVPQSFYSYELKSITDCLVYIPWFTMDEIEDDDDRSKQMLRYYCDMPGLFYADYTILPTAQNCKIYREELTTFAGSSFESSWKNKLIGADQKKKLLETLNF